MTSDPDFLAQLPGDIHWAGPGSPAETLTGLIHTAYLPPEASARNRVPLVVMIHGWQGDERVMWAFRKAAPKGVALIAPRALVSHPQGGFIWWRHVNGNPLIDEQALYTPDPNQFADGLAAIEQFIAALPQVYPVDGRRVVLMGFSQGGGVAGAYTLWRPGRVRGAALLVTTCPQPPGFALRADLLRDVPVFIAAGVNDQTVPLSSVQATRDLFAQVGAALTYGEYPTGHKLNAQGMKDLTAWLHGVIE